ncbi:MAG: class II aldolase/adducin family protein [Syntrophomonadales bacterium]|jgi:L-ribulose-5-phosphate 4-epimerase
MIYNRLRQEVVKTAREMLIQGLVIGTWGNVSARLPDRPGILITPSGMDYLALTPDDLVLVEGDSVSGRLKPSTELLLHQAIYEKRPDVGAVVHTHSLYATAFAAAERPIPAITEEMAQVIGGSVDTAPYAPCGSSALAELAARYLSRKQAVLLARHGLVGVGQDLKEAMLSCIIVEKTAQIAAIAHMIGGCSEFSPDEIKELRENYVYKYGQNKE